MRGLALLVLVGILFAACSSEPEAALEPECTPIQFRACLTSVGQVGREQCLENGSWSPCIPSVYDDASYADHGQPDSQPDAGDGATAEDAPAPDAAPEASDSGDASEASLLD